MTTVKITELSDIGANLASSTVIPVVNMAGTPITQKTNVGNIANLILEGAGVDYAEASVALLAQTVSNAAQPNITSLGTLTNVVVSGNATVNGNITSNGTAYVGNLSTTGLASITTLNVGTTANLGAVGNVKITGGTAGQVLSTDGAGNLSWASDANGGSYGNSNVATFLASYGSNTITTTGNVSVGNIIGNGQALTNIAGANVSGFVPNANVANTAFAVAAANVTGLGNIATINLTGSNSNVLYGNGVFAAVAGGNANTGNVTFDDVTVQGVNGLNLSAGADFTANLAYLQVRAGDVASHIHLDTGNNQAYDLIVGDDQNYVQVSSTGNILLSAYDSNTSQYTWTLDYNGNLILAGGNSVIQSIANSSLDPTLPNVSTMVLTPDANYNSQVLVLDPTAPGHIHLRAYAFSNIDDPAANIFLGGEDTAFEITSGANNQAVIHSNGKAWTFGNDGNISSDTLTFTTTFANVKTVEYQTAGVWDLYVEDDITGSNTAISRLNVSFKDNLIDKPQVYIENTKESDGIALRWTFDENGNLNFPRDVVGNTDPYLNIFGGSTPTIQSTDVSLAGPANLAIQADYLNYSGFNGNRIVLHADTGEVATDANMVLTTNLANTGNTYSWTFGTDGLLTLPNSNVQIGSQYGSQAILANDEPFGVVSQGANGLTILQWSDDISNTSQLSAIYVNAPLANAGDIHIRTGNVSSPNIWAFGDDGRLTFPGTPRIDTDANNFEVQAAEAINFEANTVVNIYTDAGNTTYQWQFGDDGNLTLPDTTGVLANVSITLEANDTGNITGLSLIGDSNANLYAHGNVTIVSDSSNTTATWSFVNTGDIVLPNDVVIGDDGSNGMMLSVPTVTPGTYSDWTFDQSGNLTLPTGGQIIVSGGLVSSGASPAPTINGFSITNSVGISGNGNIAGNNISATGNVTAINLINTVTVYANLPAATTAGIRAFISDANLAPIGNFGVEVSGGGGNYVPVFSDGANWCIG